MSSGLCSYMTAAIFVTSWPLWTRLDDARILDRCRIGARRDGRRSHWLLDGGADRGDAMTRGYSAIGLHLPKNHHNIGGVIRAAHCYRAAMIAISGTRGDVGRVIHCPANVTKGERHIPTLR